MSDTFAYSGVKNKLNIKIKNSLLDSRGVHLSHFDCKHSIILNLRDKNPCPLTYITYTDDEIVATPFKNAEVATKSEQ